MTLGTFRAIIAQLKRDRQKEHIQRVAESQKIPYEVAKRIVNGTLTATKKG